jgi:hypothetical protein
LLIDFILSFFPASVAVCFFLDQTFKLCSFLPSGVSFLYFFFWRTCCWECGVDFDFGDRVIGKLIHLSLANEAEVSGDLAAQFICEYRLEDFRFSF